MLTAADRSYWIKKEKDITAGLVDLRLYGFRATAKRGSVIMRARPGVVAALLKAQDRLPAGHAFSIYSTWRSWPQQRALAATALVAIRKAHPGWTRQQVESEQWKLSPPQRIITKFSSHRYGGAIDLTIMDRAGRELNMGVPVGYKGGGQVRLLYYEFQKDLSARGKVCRANRRLLIAAMEYGGFQPYLAEFWHWGYNADIRE
jgi:D-alanyl-D-alanine dipeptidase